VQAAIDHWGPRFIQAGVDANDFARTTARVETWDEWLGAWCETAEEHVALAGEAEAAGRTVTAGEAWLRAAVCFHFGKFVWVVDEARSRAAADRAVAALREAHRLLDPEAERVEAPLDGASVVANLRRPRGASRPPLVLLIAGLDSTKEEFFLLENLFHARGMATLSLDGPGQGEGGYELPLRHDFEVAASAILDAVDGFDRIGALGVSLGGYYAPRIAAALGDRIRACVALAGPYNFGDCWDRLPELTRTAFRVRSATSDDDAARRTAGTLDLTQHAQKISCPLLVVFGRLDRLIPWQHAVRLAEEASGPADLLMLENGNHGCMNVAPHHRPRTGDWLSARLTA
jgi:dipeptidyl aminopeptidase/acylaminoacyl peptidase